MESTPKPVRPVSPPAAYLGGKRNLARFLCNLLREIPHLTYVEPFVGMGGVFLRRDRRSPVEVINDLSGDVANLFRILQEHYPYFLDMLRWRITSRNEFDRLIALPADRLTDLQRAARFLYLQRLAFGGRVVGRSFGVKRDAPARFDVTKLEPMLADIHERLAGVVVEQLHYATLIEQYDAPETLFYLDPPYWDCEGDYGKDVFGRADFGRLADLLETIKGQFVLSINATDGARETFARFDVQEVDTTYSVSDAKAVKELVVTKLRARSGMLF